MISSPIKWMLDGITKAIYVEFGSEYGVYADKSNQDLITPYFTVKNINPIRRKELNNYHKHDYLFMVQYFPESETEPLGEISSVLERIYDCLEKVNGVNGLKAQPTVVDCVLNFQISYSFRTVEQTDNEVAGELTTDYVAK